MTTKQERNKDFKKYVQLTNPIHLLAVGLGSGMSPIMPGTMGSAMAIPLWLLFVGMWITLFFIPQISVLWVAIAFVAFRVFDMAKPWPIRWFDKRVPGGFGIMVDDVIAAIFSSVTVYVIALLIK